MRTLFFGWCCSIMSSAVLAVELPSSLLDLEGWVLTLPVDTERPGNPDEIGTSQLRTFADDRFFFVDGERRSVVFRAPCGGRTTKGSRFPRCELRQVETGGTVRSSWDTFGSDWSTLIMRVAVTHTPTVKPHVVCAQIHDAEDDLMMIRLEGTKLFIERNDIGDVMLNRHYQLGTPFDLKIQAGHGHVRVWYEGQLEMDWEVRRAGCYFKAGCYTQSNVERGDSPEDYGEVAIDRLEVTRVHDPGRDTD